MADQPGKSGTSTPTEQQPGMDTRRASDSSNNPRGSAPQSRPDRKSPDRPDLDNKKKNETKPSSDESCGCDGKTGRDSND